MKKNKYDKSIKKSGNSLTQIVETRNVRRDPLCMKDEIKRLEEEELKRMKKDATMRNAFIRVSAVNILTCDNEELGLHAGDVVEYTKEDIIRILDRWRTTKDFEYFTIEHDDNPNNKHFHILLVFGKKSVAKFSQIKKHFPFGQIVGCRYGVKNCAQYMIHMNHPDKYQYSWDDVICSDPEMLESFKTPGKRTMELRLQHVLEQIASGEIRECDASQKIDFELYVKYAHKIRNAFDYRRMIDKSNPSRDITVIVLQGPSRVGKSTFVKAYAKNHGLSVYFSGSGSDALDTYLGEDILALDDWNCDGFKVEDCIKLLDPHINASIKSRFKNKIFVGSTIFILTNLEITDFYLGEDRALRSAFFKRIHRVFVFERTPDEFVSEYTINKIEPEEGWDWVLGNERVHPHYKMILVPDGSGVHTFDLKKYIDYEGEKKKTDELIEALTDL